MKKIVFYLQIVAMVFFTMSGAFVGLPAAQALPGYSPGDVLINEFRIDGTQWVEFLNTTSNDIDLSATTWELVATVAGPGSGTTTLSSGIIPAQGLLTFEISGLPSAAPTLLSLNNNTSLIYAMSYGTPAFGGEPHLVGYPGAGESIALTGGTTWSTTTDITRGWYNEAPAPTIAAIVSMINAGGVVTNMGTLPDLTAAAGLYFEKRTTLGDPATALGKMTFAGPLNLTNASTTEILQNLGTEMEAAAGSMSFDARTATDLKNAGAEITIYGLDDLGYTSAPTINVKDDDGNLIATTSPDYPALTGITYDSGDLTFSAEHFTGFETGPTVTEVTPVPAVSNGLNLDYTFYTDVVGSVTIGGSCTSDYSASVIGDNTLTFDSLVPGNYTNCAVIVTDGGGHSTTLDVSDFRVTGISDDVFPNDISVVGGATVSVNAAGDASSTIWFAPYGTTVFEANGATTTSAGGTDTEIIAPADEGDYRLFVIDGDSNISQPSYSELTVDNTVPSGNISNVYLGSGSEISSGDYVNGTIKIYSNPSDNDEVARVEFYYTDFSLIAETSTVNDYGYYEAFWDTTGVSDGSYDILPRIYDRAGNYYDGANFFVTVDNTGPTVTKLGDGSSDYSLIYTCPSVACDRGDTYGAVLVFNEELDSAGKSAVESAIAAGASVAPRTYIWSGNRVRIYATEEVSFANDVVVSSVTDIVGNATEDLLIIDSQSSYIQDLIDAANPGDTVTIPAGTYTENITIDKALTLIGDIGDDGIGAGPDAPIITNSDSNRTINITADGVTIRGLIVENTNSYPAIRIGNNAAGAVISNNELRNAYAGVGLATGALNCTITKNSIHDNSYGINIGGATDNTISHNNIYNSASDGIHLQTGGCNQAGCISTVGGNNINNNNIHENSGNGIYFSSDLDTSDGTVSVDSNTLDSNGLAGVRIESGTSDVSITGNTITNNGQLELSTGIHVISAFGNSAHNNTISNDIADIGINNEDLDSAFDATQNYWGTSTGPYDGVNNPNGNPDSSIVGNVTYSPWYSDADMTSLWGIPIDNGDGTETYTITDEYTVTNDGFDLTIPAGTDITGDSSWDGQIDPPTVTTISSSDRPSRSGYTTTMRDALEVGFADGKLILSNAAKLVFPGEAGKKVGYVRPGEDFIEITDICGANTQLWADANLGTEGDCKIDDGFQLVVWTKHFTSFATYSQTANGGGGLFITYPSVPTDWITVSPGFTVTSRNVTFVLNITSASLMLVSEDQNFTNNSWETYSSNRAFTLSSGNGVKTVYFKFRSGSGGDSAIKSVAITLNGQTFNATATPAAYPVSPNHNFIKVKGFSAVYWLSPENKRYLFANREVFSSWFGDDFNGLREISQAEFNGINFGGNLTVKPGSYLKFDNSNALYYARENNDIYPATSTYGKIYQIQASFEGNYRINGATSNMSSIYNKVDDNFIKVAGKSGVYWLSPENKRYLFANREVFSSWFGDNFNGLQEASQSQFDGIVAGGNLTVKPGSYLKFDNSTNVYLVKDTNNICKTTITTTAKVYQIQASFEADYYLTGNCQ